MGKYVTLHDSDESEDSPTTKRRTLLKSLGSLSVTGAISSFAGCSSIIGSSGPSADRKVREIEMLSYTKNSNKQMYNTLQIISDKMDEELGFNMNFKPVNRDRQLQKFFTERDYDVSSGSYGPRTNRLDPHPLLYRNYHSSQTPVGSYNWTNFQNEKADELLEKQASTIERDERQDAVKKAQNYLMELPAGEMPIIHSDVINVLNTRKFKNWVVMDGIGNKNFWSWINLEPQTQDKTLTVALAIAAKSMTPLQSGQANLLTNKTTHDKLLRIGPDTQPEPWLAKEYKVSDNQKKITFTLRDDLPKWHDGKQMTAEDISFTYNYLRKWQSPFFSSVIEPIKKNGAVVEDDRTVSVTLEETFGPIMFLTFSRVPILPKHIWNKVPEETNVDVPYKWAPTNSKLTNNGYVGSGPFKFEHWRKGEEISLTANKEHFSTPKIDGLVIRIVPGASAQTTMLKNEEVDFLLEAGANPNVLSNLAENNKHLSFETLPSVGYDELSMNTRRAPFRRPNVRKAISAIIPKNTIVEEMFSGYARPAHSPTSPALKFWHSDDVKKWPETSTEEAKEFLREEGFEISDGELFYPEDEVPENPAPTGPPS